MGEVINGIQQVGIGVSDTKTVFNWYRKQLGFNILLFKDEATASLMTKYTANVAQRRNAYLSLNLKGGGGLEIWQFLDRIPQASKNEIKLGDLGINAMKIRTSDLIKTHKLLKTLHLSFLTEMNTSQKGMNHFYFKDPWGNLVQIIEDEYLFGKTQSDCGGVMGAVIGVSNMENSLGFYRDFLGYTELISDQKVILGHLGDKQHYRQVVLRHKRDVVGGFGELLGPTQIELLQALDRKPVKVFENRIWGDLGYIHLCFDVQGMAALRDKAKMLGNPFTVDSSNSFDMGDAAGHFSYVEDPDGTLIEFVETHKVPVLKSLGIYLNLKKRNPKKPLPKWLVKTLGFHRVKNDL
ncbi:VOC family protein [Maribacter sp. 2210JD10-5]|uniref:VOC family protein n=1 Tax=Maribacter sp. 2210JD10-5 TaxID=3386272 RepID=UPI0039BCC1FA